MRFVLVLTAILAGVYAYLASRLAPGIWSRLALGVPFVLVWLVPVVYWIGDREQRGLPDELLHFASYLCMGWVNFAFILTLALDAALLASGAFGPLRNVHDFLVEWGRSLAIGGSFAALAAGSAAALRGPRLRRVDIPLPDLDPALHGLRIVQITDLHAGPTIRATYVRRVVRMANDLGADIVALTGDLVDGPVARVAPHVAALSRLEPSDRRFFVPGNHEYYSGAAQWIEHFKSLDIRVLLNEHSAFSVRGARVVVGGVLDPAARTAGPGHVPRPELASARHEGPAFRLLLAHNPKLAPLGEAAGFDLQLSGHTHAGQFFPWTLAVRLVHAPHVSGLSRSGRMWVYVSAGTGSWGPPVRFGSEPELTLIRLVKQPA